jgi:hypothetical protein
MSNSTSGLSGKVLPIHPQPLRDEIFSSWLCRIAAANGMKLHTLEVQLWGRTKQIWTRDIDRSIDEETLSLVASLCGTPIAVARETCLRSFEGRLFEVLNTKGNSDWVLPAGVFHRVRRRPHMQYCPLCLANDQVPYFRKQWRTAITTFCVVHNVMLRDRCPACQAPVMFYRQEMGDRWAMPDHHLSRCSTCSFDLSTATAEKVLVIDQQAFATLRLQIDYMDQGWTWTDKNTFQYSHLYFAVLRNLVQKLSASWTPRRLRWVAQIRLGYSIDHLLNGQEPFEYRDLNVRHVLLQMATWYLLDWPKRLMGIFEVNRCRYSELMREFNNAPYWFVEKMGQLENRPVGPSNGELAAIRSLLTRLGRSRTDAQIRKGIALRLANYSLAARERS